MHPAAPSELSELIEAYSATGQAILDLGFTCREDDFDKPTQCPGWTVKDQLSHVVGLEDVFHGNSSPEVDVPDYEWLRSDFGRFMQTHVEARRSVSGQDVVAQWQELFPQRVAALHQLLADPETIVDTPVGPRRPVDLVSLRVVDMWCHEQDIRQALNRPGNLDTAAAALFTARLMSALPIRAAKAGLAVGTTVIIETTGPVNARSGVRIIDGEDGAPYGEELFSGDSHDESAKVTTIRLTTEEFTRRGAGRIDTADLRYQVEGDEDVARRVLDAMAVTP